MNTDMSILNAVLSSWDRHQQVLLNLLSLVPAGGLVARALPDSPSVAEMFTHMHHERMISVQENAPEVAGPVPTREWDPIASTEQIAALLRESHRCVRLAVRDRILANQPLAQDFAHPVHLISFLIFHEGCHHGHIKLALKATGCAISDDQAGPVIWGRWRERTTS